MRSVRYRIHSTLDDYQRTGQIQLAITDKPGDLLPPVSIAALKKMPDILSGLHPIDVNSLNDLYYLSRDNIREVRVQGEIIQAVGHDGSLVEYDINEPFQHEQSPSRRIAFMLGYMQAEKVMQRAYAEDNRYTVVQDNITTLEVLDANTCERQLMNPLDIIFSDQYKSFSKDDVARIGYICGQMSRVHSNDKMA